MLVLGRVSKKIASIITDNEVNDTEAIHLDELKSWLGKNPSPIFSVLAFYQAPGSSFKVPFCMLLSLSGIVSSLLQLIVSNLNYKLKLSSSDKQPDMPRLVLLPLLCSLIARAFFLPPCLMIICSYIIFPHPIASFQKTGLAVH